MPFKNVILALVAVFTLNLTLTALHILQEPHTFCALHNSWEHSDSKAADKSEALAIFSNDTNEHDNCSIWCALVSKKYRLEGTQISHFFTPVLEKAASYLSTVPPFKNSVLSYSPKTSPPPANS